MPDIDKGDTKKPQGRANISDNIPAARSGSDQGSPSGHNFGKQSAIGNLSNIPNITAEFPPLVNLDGMQKHMEQQLNGGLPSGFPSLSTLANGNRQQSPSHSENRDVQESANQLISVAEKCTKYSAENVIEETPEAAPTPNSGNGSEKDKGGSQQPQDVWTTVINSLGPFVPPSQPHSLRSNINELQLSIHQLQLIGQLQQIDKLQQLQIISQLVQLQQQQQLLTQFLSSQERGNDRSRASSTSQNGGAQSSPGNHTPYYPSSSSPPLNMPLLNGPILNGPVVTGPAPKRFAANDPVLSEPTPMPVANESRSDEHEPKTHRLRSRTPSEIEHNSEKFSSSDSSAEASSGREESIEPVEPNETIETIEPIEPLKLTDEFFKGRPGPKRHSDKLYRDSQESPYDKGPVLKAHPRMKYHGHKAVYGKAMTFLHDDFSKPSGNEEEDSVLKKYMEYQKADKGVRDGRFMTEEEKRLELAAKFSFGKPGILGLIRNEEDEEEIARLENMESTREVVMKQQRLQKDIDADAPGTWDQDRPVFFRRVPPTMEPAKIILDERGSFLEVYPIAQPDGRFKCSLCDKTFKFAKHVRRHSTSHSQIRRFQCERCGTPFNRHDSLLRHQSRCEFRDKDEERLHVRLRRFSHKIVKPSLDGPPIVESAPSNGTPVNVADNAELRIVNLETGPENSSQAVEADQIDTGTEQETSKHDQEMLNSPSVERPEASHKKVKAVSNGSESLVNTPEVESDPSTQTDHNNSAQEIGPGHDTEPKRPAFQPISIPTGILQSKSPFPEPPASFFTGPTAPNNSTDST